MKTALRSKESPATTYHWTLDIFDIKFSLLHHRRCLTWSKPSYYNLYRHSKHSLQKRRTALHSYIPVNRSVTTLILGLSVRKFMWVKKHHKYPPVTTCLSWARLPHCIRLPKAHRTWPSMFAGLRHLQLPWTTCSSISPPHSEECFPYN